MTIETREQFEFCRGFPIFSDNIAAAKNEWNFVFDDRMNCPEVSTVSDMFDHIFKRFKKGIYVQIHDGKLKFESFDNAKYINDWSSKVNFGNFKFDAKVQEARKWYANNYLVRYENPFNRIENGAVELKDMFENLCTAHNVPDVELFINRRDFPILKKDNTHPYEAIFGQNARIEPPPKFPLCLSMVSSSEFSEIPIPIPEDWSRATGKIFSTTKRLKASTFVDNFSQNWGAKKDMVVFRGSNTGEFFGEKRLQLCEMCAHKKSFNVKLTSISERWQIIEGSLCAPNVLARAKPLIGDFLSLQEQSEFKYIIHIEGHVQSYRLGAELAMYVVILYVESDTKLWFEQKLEAWVHYVPVKKDLSDLFEKFSWCQMNQKECERIASNARRFYETYLTQSSCLNYLYELIVAYRQQCLPVMYKFPVMVEMELISKYKQPQDTSCPILTRGRCFLNILQVIKGAQECNKKIFWNTEHNATTHLLDIEAPTKVSIKKHNVNDFFLSREIAIGLYCINPLVEEVPNFIYTYGKAPEGGFYIENPAGKTFKEYIASRAFRFETFLCILKQIALALAYAQERCGFVHGCLKPEYILLHKYPLDQYDYVISEKECWRVTTEHLVPIITNYRLSTGVSEEYSTELSKETFKDCLLVLVQSIHWALYYDVLSPSMITKVMEIFKTVSGNPQIESTRSFAQFIQTIHSSECLSSFEKVMCQNPMVLFHSIESTCFEKSTLQKTHFGKLGAIYKLPSEKVPILTRYYQQKLARIAKGTYMEQYLKSNISAERGIEQGWRLSKLTARMKNIFNDMLMDGSFFSLDNEEKETLLLKIKAI